MYQSIIDRVLLLFKKIKIERRMNTKSIYSTKFDIKILKWTNIIPHFSHVKIQSKIQHISLLSTLIIILWQMFEFDFLRNEAPNDKNFILFYSYLSFIFLSVTLYICLAMNWQVAVTTGEKAEWEAIC